MNSREAIYDREIAPLMSRIIAIVKEAKIPMFATFALPEDDETSGDCNLMCSTTIPFDGVPGMRSVIACHRIVRQGWVASPPVSLRMTIFDKEKP